jgi:hypothetical protein
LIAGDEDLYSIVFRGLQKLAVLSPAHPIKADGDNIVAAQVLS